MENPSVNGSVESTNTPVESLPAENQNVDMSTDETQEFIDNFDKDEETSAEKSVDEEPTKSEESPKEEESAEKTGFDRRKEELSNEIRSLVGQRDSLRNEVENMRSVIDQQKAIDGGFVTAEQLEEMGMTREEAIYQANIINHQNMMKQRELDAYKAEVTSLRNGMTIDRMELLRDFPIFDANSAEYNEDFTKKALEMYSRDAGLQFDEEGGVVSAGIRLYDYMKGLAELSDIRSKSAKAEARKDIEKTIAGVSPVGADIAPKTNDTDAFVNSFFD